MADKDFLVVISKMLHKQDRHTEILQGHTKLLEKQGETLETVSTTLTNFLNISTEQFGQQQKFNEQFLELNHKVVDRLDNMKSS
jgi:hypothetical protein